ncbi:MAG: hypothetical protein HDS03_08120 [Bacteroides sp.]|nr:hypothetical protein [Bacteroides sp.]
MYHSICAFANDFDNIGGGYILIGVEEENGVAKRPVCGMPTEQIDTILKEITNLNNKINPYYLPRTEPLEVDRKDIIVIWCPSGIQKGQRMVSRYYRNRRLGEFLKELSLTEGCNTDIPTIQRELARNGSPTATFETDEDRLSFLVRIPCHKGEEGIS